MSSLHFLVMLLFFSAIDEQQVEQRMELLEEKSKALQEAENIVEKELFFLEDSDEVVFDLNYQTWLEARETAKHLYDDSNENFKMEWGVFLAHQAKKREIDPFLIFELLRVETGDTFDPSLVGPETRYGKAYGMGQFMKNTGPWIAEKADLPYEDDLLFNPFYSIQLSVLYLDYLYDKYDDWDHALTAYHRGMGGLQAYIKDNGDAKSWYAVEIQENAENQESAVAYQ
ncbi:lytic transglycosylase domain-containing protein [Thalassorhabdus alkalitolerans]|uniref:Lytic transglycosylase domain-containing protein n=1 Tax=Thalassorhabdus alkalitolerans TaxID=2282697 RepID=A0ABW0YPM6_9BACI